LLLHKFHDSHRSHFLLTLALLLAMTARLTIIFLLLALASSGFGQAIPTNNLPPLGYWNPGVIGTNGSTYRTNGYFIPSFNSTNGMLNVTSYPYNAVGDGVHDDTTNIQFAINNGQNNGSYYVYFPPGTYKTTAALYAGDEGYPFLPVHMRLVGASPTNTAILGYGGNGPILTCEGAGLAVSGQQTTVNSNLLRGTTTITVASDNQLFTSNNAVGMIWQVNPTNTVGMNLQGGWTFGVTNMQGYEQSVREEMVHVVSDSSGLITFSPPLYSGWATNTAPINFTVLLEGGTSVGLENLTINNVGGADVDNVDFVDLNNSWMINCCSTNAYGYHVRVNQCISCTFEGNLIDHYYNAAGVGGGNSDYGIDCIDGAAENLIINNHFDRCRHAEIVEYGSCGNVYAYNATTAPIQQNQESGGTLSQSQLQHGGTWWNLWEGSVSPNMNEDDVLGGSTNNFFFRNTYTGVSILSASTNFAPPAAIECNNGGSSLVCDVVEHPLQTSGQPFTPWIIMGAIDQNGTKPTNYTAWAAASPPGNGGYYPYPLGYSGYIDMGASTFIQGLVSLGTAATVYQTWNLTNNWNDTGNFTQLEYQTGTNTVFNTTGYSTNNIPASLWLLVKPAFLTGYTWPGQGPDVTGFTNTITAMVNYFGFQTNTAGFVATFALPGVPAIGSMRPH
jgi:hypothetical protein